MVNCGHQIAFLLQDLYRSQLRCHRRTILSLTLSLGLGRARRRSLHLSLLWLGRPWRGLAKLRKGPLGWRLHGLLLQLDAHVRRDLSKAGLARESGGSISRLLRWGSSRVRHTGRQALTGLLTASRSRSGAGSSAIGTRYGWAKPGSACIAAAARSSPPRSVAFCTCL